MDHPAPTSDLSQPSSLLGWWWGPGVRQTWKPGPRDTSYTLYSPGMCMVLARALYIWCLSLFY